MLYIIGSANSVVLQKPVKAHNQSLDIKNKGFKLLQNMGWNEGEGIGKNQQGIQKPVKFKNIIKLNFKKLKL